MTSSSLSKVSLNRSRSIESPNRRPASRDRPTVMGAFDERPSSSQDPVNRLSTIGASPPPDEKDNAKSLKKKRRSSLSDLKSLMAQATLRGSSPSSLSSNIPTLRGRAPSASRPTSSPGKPSPQKLRLQSPAKLRERLQNEAKAINEAEASLQNELSKIGEEMAKLNASFSSPTRSADLRKLTAAISALESRIPDIVKDLNCRNDAIKSDLEKSFQASEFKVKGLDQLYKESSAENELLYEKFNAELGKIVRALRGKGKEDKEELVAKVKEGSEETARVKKENARLKREMVALRTLLKGNECLACAGAGTIVFENGGRKKGDAI
jgi:hypothetical protein